MRNDSIKKPVGEITRGKTAVNRLRRVDNFLSMHERNLLCKNFGSSVEAVFVDLGYGAKPYTPLETAYRLRKINPDLRVVGIEIEKERVAFAQKFKKSFVDFRYGGFNLPLQNHFGKIEKARIIRAFNVLRQYSPEQIDEAYENLSSYLLPGGILIDGTSDPYGRIWVTRILRKQENDLKKELLVFSTNFRLPFTVKDFQTILPKSFIHRVVPGEKIYEFFLAWKQAFNESIPLSVWGDRQVFIACAKKLHQKGYPLDMRKKFLSKGFLLLKSLF